MKSRSTQVGLGLALAVVLVIASALLRFHATSLDNVRAGEVEQSGRSNPIAASDELSETSTTPATDGENADPVARAREIASESTPELVSTSLKGITVHGVVTDNLGRALRHDDILCPRPSPSESPKCDRISFGRTLSAPLDDDGHYSIAGLAPGTRRASIHVPGYRPWGDRIELLESDHDRRFDIALEPCDVLRIRTVIQSEDPTLDPQSIREIVGDTDVWSSTIHTAVTRDAPSGNLFDERASEVERSLTGARGEREERPDPGTWIVREAIELRSGLPVYVAIVVGDRVLQSKRVDSTEEEVNFVLTLAQVRSSLGSVRFHIVDEQGREPRYRSTCRLSRLGRWEDTSWAHGPSDVDPDKTSSLEFGEVRLTGLHPGPLGIEVELPGYAPLQLETVVEPGVDRDLGEFRLVEKLSIAGHVLNPDGTPAAEVDLECAAVRDPAQGPPMFLPETRRTDSIGYFAIYDAGRSRYELQAHTRGDRKQASRPIVVSTEHGSVDGAVLQLLPTTLVRVRLEPTPRGAVTMQVEDAQGVLVEQQPAAVSEKWAGADFDLCPGPFRARAFSKNQEVAQVDFVVGHEPMRVLLTPH